MSGINQSPSQSPDPSTRHVSWLEYDSLVRALYVILKQKGFHPSRIFGIPRGGLIVAVHLSHLFDVPLLTDFSKAVPQDLVVDDLADTGGTIHPYMTSGCKVATLLCKPWARPAPDVFVERTDTYIIFPYEEEVQEKTSDAYARYMKAKGLQ